MINELIQELKGMYGREMGSGYFKHNVSKPSELEIDICDVLESLKPYEMQTTVDNDLVMINVNGVQWVEVYNYIEDYANEIHHMNSYNWNSPISNNIDYKVYRDLNTDLILIEMMTHYGITDIRCGYSDSIWLEFQSEDEFMEVLTESNKYLNVEYNNIEYYVDIKIFNDDVRVMLTEDDGEVNWEMKSKILEYMESDEYLNKETK